MRHKLRTTCIDCGAIIDEGTRCGGCSSKYEKEVRGTPAERGYDAGWVALRVEVVREWVQAHGWVCPGYKRPAHPVAELEGDHIIPLAEGGTSTKDNCGVLCPSCNARKGRGMGGVGARRDLSGGRMHPPPPRRSRVQRKTEKLKRGGNVFVR